MGQFALCAFSDEAARDIAGQIDALKANGIPYLEVRGVDGTNISDLGPGEAKELKTRLDGSGLAVWSIGSPIGKIGITDEFAPHLDKFLRTLETAHILGAEHMRIFSFYVEAEKAEKYREAVMERLNAFVEHSKGSGVLLCHENEKGIYGDIPARCLDILQAVDGMRCVFDPANFVQCGAEPLAAWDVLSPYVEYLHIKDADQNGINVPAGTGVGEISEIIRRYADIGGRVLSLEPHLWEFAGLAGLEQGGDAHIKNTRRTQREAFDLGAESLKNIMKNI